MPARASKMPYKIWLQTAGATYAAPTMALAPKLKSELESSTDEGLVLATGELLVEESAALGENGQSPDSVKSAAFGRQLLDRVRRGR